MITCFYSREFGAQPGGVAVTHEGVRITEGGIWVHGRKAKHVTLFVGEPAMLFCEGMKLANLRAIERLLKRIPTVYLDLNDNLCEGETGRIIFQAH